MKHKFLPTCGLIFIMAITNVATANVLKQMPAPQITVSQEEAKRFFSYKEGDLVIGDPKEAKIFVTGYTAYSCPHCNHFIANILPKLKKQYFDTDKKIVFIYRLFPMSVADLKAKQLLMCKNNMTTEEAIKFNETLYHTSHRWAYQTQPEKKLGEIAKIFGFSDSEIAKCLSSKNLENEIMKDRTDLGIRVKIYGVPLIVVNGKPVQGYGYKNISAAIEEELKNESQAL